MVSKKVIVGGVAAIIVIGGVTAGLMNSGSTSKDKKDGSVGITTKGLNAEEKAATDKAKQAIEDGKVKVPNHPAGSEYNQNF